ncbi:hypothetical protein DL771_000833 [Monosporascus sp. 5C6A]|nr:hypothetical protein DL771_000833 [Monosporascus sp. 5C6A]
MASIVIFEVGSLTCGVAPTSEALIVGRAIAGVGAAGVSSGTYTIIALSAEPKKRRMFTGILGASYGIASVVGPLIGGVFSDYVTWRRCFYINLPIGGVSAGIVLLLFKTPPTAKPTKTPLKEKISQMDPLGTLLIMGCVVYLMLSMQYGGQTYAWDSGVVIGLLVGFFVIFIAFVLEARLGERAMLVTRIMKRRGNLLPEDLAPVTVVILFFQTLGGAFFVAIAQCAFVNEMLRILPFSAPHVSPMRVVSVGATEIRADFLQDQLGAQWGDEGKGKLTDILAPEAQLCARAAGGHNAGHSIVANGVSYSFHLLPSGLVNPYCLNLIGSSVVAHIPSFFKELDELEQKGLSNVHDRIFISDRVHIDLDLHIAVDGLEEVELGAEVFNAELFESKLRRLASGYQKRYGDLLKYDIEEELARFQQYRPRLAKYTVDAVSFIKEAQEKNMKILCEGANALMLDLDWGSYPYVTSSSTGIGGVVNGLSLDIKKINEVIGVVKCYTTRGTSTGRRRRCGWLDLVVVKYSTDINHYTALNLTKLDVLDTFPTLKIAIAYKDPVTGEEIPSYPADLDLLNRAEVIYHEMPGWNKPTTNAKTFYDLPKEAQDYIIYIEEFIGVKIKWIGTGPDREAMIKRF